MMVCSGPTCKAGVFARHPEALEFLVAYEDATATWNETTAGFQMLLDTGAIDYLSPKYRRIADYLLRHGVIVDHRVTWPVKLWRIVTGSLSKWAPRRGG